MAHVTRRLLTRRMLLTDFGAAGLGVVILGACGGSSSDSDSTASPATDPAATDPSSAEPAATDPSATEPPPTDLPSTDAPGTSLQLQHVSLGFVSAYVLLRGNEAAIVDTGVPGSLDAIGDGLTAVGASFSDVQHVVITHKHGDHQGGLAEVLGMGVLNTPGHTPGSISLFDTETGILVAGDAVNGDGAGGLTGANPDFTEDMTLAGDSIAKLAALESSVVAFGHGGPPVEDAMVKLATLTTG